MRDLAHGCCAGEQIQRVLSWLQTWPGGRRPFRERGSNGGRRAGGVRRRGVLAAVGVQEGVAHGALGDQPLQLRDAREYACFIGGQDQHGARILHDQRADARRRLGRQLIARAVLVRAQVGAQVALLFARQGADVAGVADAVFDRRVVNFQRDRRDRQQRQRERSPPESSAEERADGLTRRRASPASATAPSAPASAIHQLSGRPYSRRSP